jgi:addiction module RelE/StbE family toxin
MVQIIWTELALYELKHIKEYISFDSVFYAKNVVQKIRNKTKLLKQFPKRGGIIPEINIENYRQLIEGNYRIMYKISGDKVYILSIFHGARDFKRTKIEG